MIKNMRRQLLVVFVAVLFLSIFFTFTARSQDAQVRQIKKEDDAIVLSEVRDFPGLYVQLIDIAWKEVDDDPVWTEVGKKKDKNAGKKKFTDYYFSIVPEKDVFVVGVNKYAVFIGDAVQRGRSLKVTIDRKTLKVMKVTVAH